MMLLSGCANSEKDKIEYLNKRYTSIDVTKEERVSMRMLTLLIDGFEKQDVILLKSVSAAHQDKSYSDIKKAFDKTKKLNARNYKLHNVEVLNTTPLISGEFTYSFVFDKSNVPVETMNITTLNFVMGEHNGKALVEVEPSGKDMGYSLMKKSDGKDRFGVEDIRKLN